MSLLLLGVFAFLSYFSAVFAGFGGVIIALTLGAHLYPIKWLLPVLLPLTLLANLYIFIRHHRHIDTRVFFRRMLPYMGAGLVIGFALFQLLHGDLLRMLFGFIVILVSVRELIRLMGRNHNNTSPMPRWLSAGCVFTAGVVHGVYASGGPVLVYAVNRIGLTKSAFRSTLSMVWLTMNIVLTTFYTVAGRIDLQSLKFSVFLLPSLVLGILAGEYLHRRMPERGFKMAAYALLALSGLFVALK